jgi:hypothetical protein
MLSSVQMAKLVKSLSEQFDYVLLDSPPMLAVADVAALSPNAGGFILVVRQAHAEREAVQEAGSFLAGQNGKFTCLIVNEAENASYGYYYRNRKKPGSLLELVKRISKQIRDKRNSNLDRELRDALEGPSSNDEMAMLQNASVKVRK